MSFWFVCSRCAKIVSAETQMKVFCVVSPVLGFFTETFVSIFCCGLVKYQYQFKHKKMCNEFVWGSRVQMSLRVSASASAKAS
jgi:hypothetical protein